VIGGLRSRKNTSIEGTHKDVDASANPHVTCGREGERLLRLTHAILLAFHLSSTTSSCGGLKVLRQLLVGSTRRANMCCPDRWMDSVCVSSKAVASGSNVEGRSNKRKRTRVNCSRAFFREDVRSVREGVGREGLGREGLGREGLGNMSWNDERVETLKRLWAEGLSASQIATELGGITRNAVIGKVHRLGLSGRAKSPTTANPRPRKARAHSHMIRVARPAVRVTLRLQPAFEYEARRNSKWSTMSSPWTAAQPDRTLRALMPLADWRSRRCRFLLSVVDKLPAACPIVPITARRLPTRQPAARPQAPVPLTHCEVLPRMTRIACVSQIVARRWSEPRP